MHIGGNIKKSRKSGVDAFASAQIGNMGFDYKGFWDRQWPQLLPFTVSVLQRVQQQGTYVPVDEESDTFAIESLFFEGPSQEIGNREGGNS